MMSVLTHASIAVVVFAAGISSGQVHQQTPLPAVDPANPAPFAGQMVVHAHVRTPAQLLAVNQIATNIWSCNVGIGDLDVQVTADQRAALEAVGIATEIWIPDVQAVIDRERAEMEQAGMFGAADWFATFRSLPDIYARLDQLASQQPTIASTFSMGLSLESRDMRGIRITGPDQPGNPKSSRPQVMFEGGQHAREWASPMSVMYIADALVNGYDSDPRIHELLDRTEIIVVPVVNVDGYTYTWANTANRLWRKNRRNNGGGSFGVDLNRNWAYQWGGEGASGTPSSETYYGTAPFSEPETQRLRDFMNTLPRLKAHIDYHTYSQLILSPWGYTGELPPQAATFDAVNLDLKQGIEGVYGTPYKAGPTYFTVYPAAGVVQDWLFGVKGVYAWGIELRDTGRYGFTLPSAMILPTARENFEGALRLAEWTSQALKFSFPNGFPDYVNADASTTITVKVASGSIAYAGAVPTLRWRTSPESAFASLPMTASGANWTGVIPAAGCRATLEYYIEASTTTSQLVTFPYNAPMHVLTAQSTQRTTVFSDDAETDKGWSLSIPGDTTIGRWERAVPSAVAAAGNSTTPALPTQTGSDHSASGTRCWVTGAAAGSGPNGNDVDSGQTTLTSPQFNCSPPRATHVYETRASYWVWYFNSQTTPPASDSLLVQASNDGGSTWTQIEEISDASGVWTQHQVALADFLPITDRMKLRFIARDGAPDSISEAAIDDVLIEIISCPKTSDVDGSGGTPDASDVDAFFAAWLAGDPVGDFDESGGTPDAADIDDFFYAWLLGQ